MSLLGRSQGRPLAQFSAELFRFAIGGHDGMQHLASAEVFDPREGVGWRRVTPMRTCRRGIAAAALDGAIYAVGGLDDTTCFSVSSRLEFRESLVRSPTT